MKKVILTLLVIVTYFFANDGYGALGAGGIIIGKTDDIAMAKEVLEISYNKIKVDYEFINESDKDITETIVFPLPKFLIGEGLFSDHDPYLKMIDSFKVFVDGKPVVFQTKVRAVMHTGEFEGQDVTEKLLKLGFSERDIIASEEMFYDIIVPKIELLKANGLFVEDNVLWDNYITYEWKQTFKAHEKVKISHEYQPLPGRGSSIQMNNYCYISSTAQSYDPEHTHDELEVNYILRTANTWKDGIRDFKLIIRKKPHEVASLCFPVPLKQTNPFTYEVQLKNFKPEQDLKVYFGNISWDDYKLQ